MYGMFSYATNFNRNLNNWTAAKLSAVTEMTGMFNSCPGFNATPSNYTTIKQRAAVISAILG
jgi:hypothetical protein